MDRNLRSRILELLEWGYTPSTISHLVGESIETIHEIAQAEASEILRIEDSMKTPDPADVVFYSVDVIRNGEIHRKLYYQTLAALTSDINLFAAGVEWSITIHQHVFE